MHHYKQQHSSKVFCILTTKMKSILIIVAMVSPVTLMSNLFKRQSPDPTVITSTVTQQPLPCSTVANGGGCYPLSQCSGASTISSNEGVSLATPGFQICDRDSVTKEPYFCCNKIPDATTPSNITTITTTTTTTPEPPFECAKIKIPAIWTRDVGALQFLSRPAIFKGYNSTKFEFPYMAALVVQNGMNRTVHCGASIISRRSLLTAAHCFNITLDPKEKFIAVIGDYILGNSLENSNPIEVDVEKNILHPDFIYGRVYNDVAIVVLKTALNFSKAIAPVCLPSKQMVNETFAGVSSIVTGWGRNEYGRLQTTLQYAIIPVTTQQECQNAYSDISGGTALPNGITIDIICAGLYNDTRRDTCWGDSGGPLVKADQNGSQWIQIGVVSAGIECGKAYPGLYTRTTQYLDWIAANRVP